MTDHADLIARLRDPVTAFDCGDNEFTVKLLREAADALEAASKEEDRLTALLNEQWAATKAAEAAQRREWLQKKAALA